MSNAPTPEIRILMRVSIKCFFATFAKLQKAAIKFVMPVHLSAWNKSASKRRISVKFYGGEVLLKFV